MAHKIVFVRVGFEGTYLSEGKEREIWDAGFGFIAISGQVLNRASRGDEYRS